MTTKTIGDSYGNNYRCKSEVLKVITGARWRRRYFILLIISGYFTLFSIFNFVTIIIFKFSAIALEYQWRRGCLSAVTDHLETSRRRVFMGFFKFREIFRGL